VVNTNDASLLDVCLLQASYFARSGLDLFEQARAFDRDNCLVREGVDELDLAVGEAKIHALHLNNERLATAERSFCSEGAYKNSSKAGRLHWELLTREDG
jgi:hypothetical protein